MRKAILYATSLFILFSGLIIYLKGDEIQSAFESDADPISFLTGNGELPSAYISSDDTHIPALLRGKSTLSPLKYRFISQHDMRVLTITATQERIKMLTAEFTPKWTSVHKNNKVMLLPSGIQAIWSPAGKDSIMTLTIVSPIHTPETGKQ